MKRILFIHNGLPVGGAETTLINYLKILSSVDDYKIDLLLINDFSHTDLAVEKNNPELINNIPRNITLHWLLTDFESDLMGYLKKSKDLVAGINQQAEEYLKQKTYEAFVEKLYKINDFVSTYHYDLIINFCTYLHDFTLNYGFGKISPRPITAPMILWVHSQYHVDCLARDPNTYQTIYQRHQAIIALNKEMEANLIHNMEPLGLNKKIYILENPFDFEAIKSQSEQMPSDKSEHDLLKEPYIVQVSRLGDNIKNHFQMINIFKKLKEKGIREKLYMIGDGWNRPHLEQHAQNLGLGEEVLFLGNKTNPFPYMKNARLFIHTSLNEGFGNVLVESMACGTPVVAMDCPVGPREILDHGRYGVLVPLNDENRFVEETFALLNDDQKLNSFKALLPQACARYGFSLTRQKLINIFNEVMQIQ